MTIVSNDPAWWPFISLNLYYSYWAAAAAVIVVYDWVLTLGQEIELIWVSNSPILEEEQYIYNGSATETTLVSHDCAVLDNTIYWNTIFFYGCSTIHSIGPSDRYSQIMYYATNGITVVVPAMLGVIMIARLHAMYQGSRIMLIFLVIIFLAINIACGAIVVIGIKSVVEEELILSGISMCSFDEGASSQLLISITWILNTVWEALALCLSIRIAVKHFRELRRLNQSTGSTIGDCFRVLIKSHVLYFAGFAGVSSLQLADISPELWTSTSIVSQILQGALPVLLGVQMFVLGPRLILSVRDYHAKLVADSDAETSMRSIVFERRVHVSTSSTV
ncbi:hypothetical protein BDR07DRAFT_1610675 [Suillus spraguei]|nr:hypothetical protein BDR07DRAFT_1610675 [Suillus spraguei]